MKNLTAFILLLSISFLTNAQQRPSADELVKYEITGKVIDKETNTPLEYATVVLTPMDGSAVTGGLTDANGAFNVEAKKGMYNISVEFISFKTFKIANKDVSSNINLGTIILEVDSETLDEVSLVAEKTTVEIRLDKKIYNVGKDLTVRGGTASDVLDNIPSVTVDVEGGVALRGNENVRILINGKPSALVGTDPAEALRQFPAESIEKVEVITSPSARYDAEGTAGIINIILRRDKILGFNGSVILNAGSPELIGGSVNLNYRTKKVNYFANVGYDRRDQPGSGFYNTEYFNPDVENPFVNEVREYNRARNGFNLNTGMEYFFNEKTSLLGSFIYRDSKRNTVTDNTTNEFLTANDLASTDFRQETEDETDNNVQFNFNFTKNFDKDGHKLTLDAQFETSKDDENSLITDDQIFPNQINNGKEQIATIEDNDEVLFQGDYVYPIGENTQFEAGFRSVFKDQSTDYTLEEEDVNTGAFILNENVSNVFDYKENIHALYSQYGSKFGKFSALFGLRVEIADISGETSGETDTGINLNFDKNYAGLFPTANLAYEVNDSESFSLGYNRRINRPRHWSINPFPSRSSETQVRQGNPDLNPTYSNAFDVGYLKRWEKVTFNTSVYYNLATDAVQFINQDSGELSGNGIPIIISSPINLATDKRFGFEYSLSWSPSKWLRLSNSFNLYNSKREGEYENVDYGFSNTNWFTRFTSKVTLPSKIDWQTNGTYRGRSEDSQSINKGNLSINMALSKDILKDKATISFNVSDLLNDRKRKSTITTPSYTQYTEFQWRERQFSLSFTYRFNQKKNNRQERRPENVEEEGGEGFGG
tara:strand:- start:58106 stop:60580 length:2475 start_codon:yes stop_codon:yes gene_type:complete